MSDREATHNELKVMYCDRVIELQAYKKIAKDLLVMVDEWNLTKCGENSKVRKKIREFKTVLGEIK